MEEGSKYGRIFHCMKGIGLMIRLMEWEDSFMQMVMFILDNGKMTKLMGKGYTYIKMAQNIQVIGLKILSMDLVGSNG